MTISGQVAVDKAQPDAIFGIGGEGSGGWHARCGKFFANLTILNAKQFCRVSNDFRPNGIVPVFRDRSHRSDHSVIGASDRIEYSILIDVQTVVDSHPEATGMIFEQ